VNSCFGKWGLDNTTESQGFVEAADPGASVDAGKLTDLALDFVRRHARRPFFLYLNHHLVHVPLPPKVEPERIERHRDRLRSTDKNPAYAAAVEKLDEEIGRVIEALGQQDLTRRTLFIFISDNGGFLGTDTEMVTSNAPLREGKASLYEGGIRVPLIVRWPGTVAQGTICSDPVINLDLFPTLAEIVGGPAAKPRGSDGISLVATLRGEPLAPRTLHWHFPHYRRSMAGIAASPSSAIRDGDWKLIHFYADDHIEVFNLARDPGESRDLAATQPAQARRLREKLDEWRRRVDAQPPRPNPAYAPAASRGD
jgi:arylsulfatase A-like enzyme